MLKFALPAAVAATLVLAAPAGAVTDLTSSTADSLGQTGATRTATAYCPAGQRVVGGAGGIEWNADGGHVVITQMTPVHPLGGADRYIVSGQGASSEDWTIEAQALCADPIAGMHTAIVATNLSSSASQRAQATCNSGERVLGTGGWVIQPTGGQVALQMAGPDKSGELAYAQAHEDDDGYAGDWNVLAYAVCAPKPRNYAVVTHDSPETGSQDYKGAYAPCPDGTAVIDVGGGAAFDAPGAVSLYRLLLLDYGRSGEANTAENTPTSASWGATGEAICG